MNITDEESKMCIECDGVMSPIVIMDKSYGRIEDLEYRHPDDTRSFWSGKFPTSGPVRAFLCGECGRISLYGFAPDAKA